MPILKGLKHYRAITAVDAESALYFDIRNVCTLAVLRAPMVGVRVIDGQIQPELLRWVRLVRAEPGSELYSGYADVESIDVVHADFLADYVETTFSVTEELVRRGDEFAISLLTGQALRADRSPDSRSEDTPWFEELRPPCTPDEFMKKWHEKSRVLHSGMSDREAPTTP